MLFILWSLLTAIWYILRPFDIGTVDAVIFSRFGILYPENLAALFLRLADKNQY
jgi:hypothetical protein